MFCKIKSLLNIKVKTYCDLCKTCINYEDFIVHTKSICKKEINEIIDELFEVIQSEKKQYSSWFKLF